MLPTNAGREMRPQIHQCQSVTVAMVPHPPHCWDLSSDALVFFFAVGARHRLLLYVLPRQRTEP